MKHHDACRPGRSPVCTAGGEALAALIFLTLVAPGGGLSATELPTQSTAFIYNGELLENGKPAEGVFDLEFVLYSQPTGGEAMGRISREEILVREGAFTTVLDFGLSPASCRAPTFISTNVRPEGAESYATIEPRQRLIQGTPCDVPGDLHVGGNIQLGASYSVLTSQGALELTSNNGEALFLNRFAGGGGVYVGGWGGPGELRVFGITNSDAVHTNMLRILGGADIAEPFDVSGSSVLPGMVLAIDGRSHGRLRPTEQEYDRAVAGIVSGANGLSPGLLMRQLDSVADGQFPLALSGRVYCLADATTSPIRPGDLLTSSSKLGHAMKASDPERSRGAVIGKAMSELTAGTGYVLVLVQPQ